MDLVVKRSDNIGTTTREHARTRGAADGILTVGAFEKRSASGELVDVRRVNVIGSVAVQLGPKIIDTDYENVRLVGSDN